MSVSFQLLAWLPRLLRTVRNLYIPVEINLIANLGINRLCSQHKSSKLCPAYSRIKIIK